MIEGEHMTSKMKTNTTKTTRQRKTKASVSPDTKETPDRLHDASYRQIFSHAKVVRSLLEGFVEPKLLTGVNLDKMERVETTFITKDLDRRISDVIWRIPRPGRKTPVYIFLLLEFQSSPDKMMALRMLTYHCLLYQNLLKEKPKWFKDHLPPVLPLVIYNGKERWSAKTSMRELFSPYERAVILSRQPDFEYYLIDIARLELSAEVKSSITALLFALEQAKGAKELQALIPSLITLIHSVGSSLLDQDLTAWIIELLKAHEAPVQDFVLHSLDEVQGMLAENMGLWFADAKKAGLEEGRQEGRQDGLIEALNVILTTKFGEDPKRAPRLQALNIEQLQHALAMTANAQSEDEVFAPSST